MATALIVHAPMSAFGGAELVNVHVMRILSETGYSLALLSDLWEPSLVSERFGVTISCKVDWRFLSPSDFVPKLPIASVYQRLNHQRSRQAMIDSNACGKYDMVFDTFNGWDMPRGLDAPRKLIYFHEPPVLRRPRGTFRDIYYRPAEELFRGLMSKIKDAEAICNSTYTKNELMQTYGIEGTIIYPPANVEFFREVADCEPRQDTIIVFGRFGREKRLTLALEALRTVVRTVPTARVSIMGFTGSQKSAEIIRELTTTVRGYDLSECATISIDPNLSAVREKMSTSKIILSTTTNETFGMAVVEGMAAGCVPIVHRSGGQFLDVLDRDKYGMSYSDASELAAKIETVLLDEKLRLQLKAIARERASAFGVEQFRRQMLRKITR